MNLTGTVLVSSPFLFGEIFEQSVIFVYSHDEELGAQGVVINHSSKLTVDDLMHDLEYTPDGEYSDDHLYVGGVSAQSAIMMVHSSEWWSTNTLPVTPEISVSSDMMMFERLLAGDAPDEWRIYAGQCDWYPGQLEEEIDSNLWQTLPASPAALFGGSGKAQWRRGVRMASRHAVSSWF